jgi:hypothetical protein
MQHAHMHCPAGKPPAMTAHEQPEQPLCHHSQLAQHSQMQHGHVEVGGGLRGALPGTLLLPKGISRG